jgi:hypothetical protein
MRPLAMFLALGLSFLAGVATAAPSRLVRVEVQKVEAAGTFAGVAYVRVGGQVHGVVAPGEDVVGLAALPKNGAGEYEYASGFELIAPAAGQPQNEVVYVDAENRGRAISQGALGAEFLPNHKTSYARVQWQTGISPGVPAKAQGVGLVIMRDFARWLAGRTPATAVSGGYIPAPYGKLILGGISQSAWLVNTFVAEGFNVDPAGSRRVFDGAIAIDGLGNWLAINRTGAERGAPQSPYVDPNGRPLPREVMLRRPQTDPVFIDVANYTDYYRLRASMTASDYSSPRFRRYDFPSPHAVGSAQAGVRCNGGQPVEYNQLRYGPYMRALVLGLEKAIGVKAASGARSLPHSITFDHSRAPPASEHFNALPMAELHVPTVDDDAWPTGGVRFPEADLPLGAPAPPAIPPVVTTSIDATCGNFGGFRRFDAVELVRRYENRATYRQRYAAKVDRLIREGFLLSEDKAALIEAAGAGLP